MQGARAHALCQGDGEVICVALGFTEDDGAAAGAVALDEVRHHSVALTPVCRNHEVLHACGRLWTITNGIGNQLN